MRRRERSHAIATCLAVLLTAPIGAASVSGQDRAFSDAVARVRRHSVAEQHLEAHALAESLYLATEAREGPDAPATLEARELAVAHTFILRYRPDPATCALADQALRARERESGPDSLKVLHALQLAARCSHRLGDVGRAIGLQQRALAIEEQARGAASYDLSVQLNNLSAMLYDAGRFGEMIETMRRALAIREALVAPSDPDVLRLRNNLAVALEASGDLGAARPLFEAVLAGYEARLGPDHGRTGYALNNLAVVLAATGERAGARNHYERALRIREHAVGVNAFEIGETLTNLAELLMGDGDMTGALQLLERALAIHTQHLRPNHPLRVTTLLALAAVHRAAGDHARARARAGEAHDAVTGSEDPDPLGTARALVSLGETELAAGHPGDAVAPLERAVALYARTLGDHHPRLAEARRVLAEALVRAGDDRSLSHAIEAERVLREHLRRVFRTLPERQALAMREDSPHAIGAALSALAGMPAANDSLRFAVWDAVVRSRGLLLDEMASRRRFGAGSDTVAARLERLFVTARQREVNLAVRLPRDEAADILRARLDQARSEAAAAEAALARSSAEFRREIKRGRVGLTEVLDGLEPGDALLAYVRFRRLGPPTGAGASHSREEYAAFVAGAGDRRPSFIPLGEATAIDATVTRWHRAARDRNASEAAYRRVAAALRRQIWEPIAARLGRADRTFVVADGALTMVNLATLPSGGTSYLVESGPTFHQLTTERGLVEEHTSFAGGAGMLVAVGGVDYDGGVGGPPATVELPESNGGTHGLAGRTAGCSDLASLRFGPLDQTRREVEDVCRRWSADTDARPTRTLTGTGATEAAFRSLAPRGRMLHLATHGYFLEGSCAGRSPPTHSGGPPPREPTEDPLLRSGLALAGANVRQDRDASEDDGVLTAAEIAALDLSGVGWVVLSGCDTGLGTPAAMEGVLGLRRAFQVAGAQTVIMSLWGVEDAPARRWARELYAGRIDRGLGAPEAVRRAARSLLEAQRAGHLGGHPAAWGAFISGEGWR